MVSKMQLVADAKQWWAAGKGMGLKDLNRRTRTENYVFVGGKRAANQ